MNNKVMKHMFLIVLMASLFFSISSSASAIRHMNFSTTRLGGALYPLGEAFSVIINKYVPDVRMNATTAEGSYESIRRLKSKTTDLAFILHNAGYQNYFGLGVFKGKPYKDLRILFNADTAPLQCITLKKSGITSIEGFKGKRIGTGTGGSSIPDGLEALFKVYGMSANDVELVPLSRKDRVNALGDRNIDVAFMLIGGGAALMRELMSIQDIIFIRIPMEKLKEVEKLKPYWAPGYMNKDIYPKEFGGKDYWTMTLPVSVMVDASLPTDLGYNICKAIWDHYDEVVQMNKYFGRQMKPEDAINALSGIPVHQGAEKYFNEKGLLK